MVYVVELRERRFEGPVFFYVGAFVNKSPNIKKDGPSSSLFKKLYYLRGDKLAIFFESEIDWNVAF